MGFEVWVRLEGKRIAVAGLLETDVELVLHETVGLVTVIDFAFRRDEHHLCLAPWFWSLGLQHRRSVLGCLKNVLV